MACVLTSGRTEPCKDAIGGLSKAYLMDWIEDAFTITAGEATAINGSITAVYQYDLLNDGNNLVETVTADTNNGTTIYEQVLTLALKKQTQASAEELALVAHARPIIVVVDRMGNHRVVGLVDGTNLTGTFESGGAKGDFNGYNISFNATETQPAPTLDSATVTALELLISATNVTP